MSTQLYSTVASRNLISAELEMLDYVGPIQVLGSFGDQKVHPLNKTDTISFRRVLPFGSSATETPVIDPSDFVVSEGVTPTAHTIDYENVTVTISQKAVLFRFSSKAELLYEDNIPADMIELTGRTIAEIAELELYGVVKGGSSVIYANGSTRAGLSTPISLNKIQLAVRTLEGNRAVKPTKMVSPGPDFDTSPVEEAYPVFIHTDMVSDVRRLPNFTPRVKYGTAITPLHPREVGAVEDCRFITSPLLAPILAAGAAVGATGMVAKDSTNTDVYCSIVMGDKAWGHVSLKGHDYSGIKPILISSQTLNHANPAGTHGYAGASFWTGDLRLNEHHMVRLETCVSELAG